MSPHTFSAASMAEAMERVRVALGPDAVIVSTGKGEAGGVEVVAAGPAAGDGREAETAVAAALDHHGVPATLAGELVRIAGGAGEDDPARALAAALAARLRFTAQPPTPGQTPGAPLVLVGPPGAGRTVTAAKLASLCVLADAPVALLTTDTARAGGHAQLDHFARLLDCPLVALTAPEALAARLAEQAGRACIVDTMGVNPFDAADLAGLDRLVRGAGCDVALVLPAGGDAREAAEIAAAFAAVGARWLIATRLDATRRLGGLLAAADGGLALGRAGVSPYIAGGLGRLDPLLLARLLLEGPDARRPSPLLRDSVG